MDKWKKLVNWVRLHKVPFEIQFFINFLFSYLSLCLYLYLHLHLCLCLFYIFYIYIFLRTLYISHTNKILSFKLFKDQKLGLEN